MAMFKDKVLFVTCMIHDITRVTLYVGSLPADTVFNLAVLAGLLVVGMRR
jgi:hypothetical protein